MNSIIKTWESGGNLSVTYDGDGDGQAIFSSDVNTGEERTMDVTFIDASRNVIVVRTVRQASGQVSGETYTKIAYLASTGEQHIELDYILKDTDAVEVLYQSGEQKSADQFLFGSPNAWVSTYNLSSYVRFGHSTSKSVSNGYYRCKVRLSQGAAIWDGGQLNTSLTYTELTESPINVFAGRSTTGSAYNRGSFTIFYLRIFSADGSLVVDLTPAKRDSDNKVGMLDLISGKFYINADDGEDFIAGSEMRMGNKYERIDELSFNNDKAFDTGYCGNEQTYIDVLFQRTDTSGSDYLYGCSPSGKARITAYLSSSGAWRYGTTLSKTFNTNKKDIFKANVSPSGININNLSATYTATAFTTVQNIPLGGHRPSETNSNITKTYQGYIYYFRMRHSDALLIDWYPCRRKEDGVEGFWDCVTQTFVEPI